MVTLRRDIAAAGSNKVFDRKNRDSEVLTDYDLFMEKKKQQRTLCDYKPVAPTEKTERKRLAEESTDETDAFAKIFHRETENNIKDTYQTDNDEEYKKYLLEQLNRKEPGKLLDKESFYQRVSAKPEAAYTPSAAEPVKHGTKKLSKNGKIFVAVYVLVVALVASIILAVNSVTEPHTVDASAIGDNAKGEIAPMDVPVELDSETSNWFDALLDGLSNG